jgi:hypothetical protein
MKDAMRGSVDLGEMALRSAENQAFCANPNASTLLKAT